MLGYDMFRGVLGFCMGEGEFLELVFMKWFLCNIRVLLFSFLFFLCGGMVRVRFLFLLVMVNVFFGRDFWFL